MTMEMSAHTETTVRRSLSTTAAHQLSTTTKSEPQMREAVLPTRDPVAWNMLQLTTVMLVVVGTIRTGATYIRRHKHE